MTAATAAHITNTTAAAPRTISRNAVVLAAAVTAAVIGAIVAPYAALGILVLGVVLVGMTKVGTAIDRTFDSLVALGS
jgi:hypothetical protein